MIDIEAEIELFLSRVTNPIMRIGMGVFRRQLSDRKGVTMQTTLDGNGDQMRIHHDAGWIGKCTVAFVHRDEGKEELREWEVYAQDLTNGSVREFLDTKGRFVPHTTIAKAVCLATKSYLKERMQMLLENKL